jgi:hypothetical protein
MVTLKKERTWVKQNKNKVTLKKQRAWVKQNKNTVSLKKERTWVKQNKLLLFKCSRVFVLLDPCFLSVTVFLCCLNLVL